VKNWLQDFALKRKWCQPVCRYATGQIAAAAGGPHELKLPTSVQLDMPSVSNVSSKDSSTKGGAHVAKAVAKVGLYELNAPIA
jgi:hypothetical protein